MSEQVYRQLLQATELNGEKHYGYEPVTLSELLWVDCQIEMPPENAVVVIDIDEDGDVWTGYWREEGGEVRWYGDNDGALLTVTHWQRRVDPPEAKEEKPEYDKKYWETDSEILRPISLLGNCKASEVIPFSIELKEELYQKMFERAKAEGKI